MSRVLAAIDSSASARPVLSTAVAMAELLGADVDALHVRERWWETAQAAADAAGVKLTVASGPTVQRVVEEARRPDVVAVVVGARGTPAGRRPAGHVATRVATSILKPIVVVPPECACPVRFGRILVPLEAVVTTAAAVDPIVRAACAAGAEVIVLHIFDGHAVPLFTDQPQHELEAWLGEFRRRFCDHPQIRLELRAGVPGDQVLAVADELQADALLLAWSQRLAVERAALVTAILRHSRIPVIMVPAVRPGVRGGLRPQAQAETSAPGRR